MGLKAFILLSNGVFYRQKENGLQCKEWCYFAILTDVITDSDLNLANLCRPKWSSKTHFAWKTILKILHINSRQPQYSRNGNNSSINKFGEGGVPASVPTVGTTVMVTSINYGFALHFGLWFFRHNYQWDTRSVGKHSYRTQTIKLVTTLCLWESVPSIISLSNCAKQPLLYDNQSPGRAVAIRASVHHSIRINSDACTKNQLARKT